MDKKKFEAAILRIANLADDKRDVFCEDVHKYIDREIIKAARELIAAADDDIAEKPTPAESSPENKGYLPNTYFANNGIEYTD